MRNKAKNQQAEPVCECNMRQKLVGDGCAACNPAYAEDYSDEPAPAQSETNDQIAAVMLLHGTPEQQAEAARYAGLTALAQGDELEPWAYGWESRDKTRAKVDRAPHGGTWFPLYRRPAQTEQQPIRLPERKRTEHLPKEYKIMTVVRAGLEAYNRALDDVAALNAVPIAQTAPQPEQSGLVEALLNLLAAFDNPIARRKLGSEFSHQAIESARLALSAQGGEA